MKSDKIDFINNLVLDGFVIKKRANSLLVELVKLTPKSFS